jgi:hypothetical protein
VMVVVIDGFGFGAEPFPRGSVSAYYYSGMRDEFVVIIGATGIFLVAYKIAERNLHNLASIVAGVAAVLVAIFPTGVSSALVALTPSRPMSVRQRRSGSTSSPPAPSSSASPC